MVKNIKTWGILSGAVVLVLVVLLCRYYTSSVKIEHCGIVVDDLEIQSSQPLGEYLQIWNRDVTAVSLSGDMRLAIFTTDAGFQIVKSEYEKLPVNNLTQVFVIDDCGEGNAQITFQCNDNSAYRAKLTKKNNRLWINFFEGS